MYTYTQLSKQKTLPYLSTLQKNKSLGGIYNLNEKTPITYQVLTCEGTL